MKKNYLQWIKPFPTWDPIKNFIEHCLETTVKPYLPGGVTFLPGPTLTVLPYARLPYTTVYPTGGVTFLPGPTLTVLPYVRLPYTTVYPTGGVTFLPGPTLTVLPYVRLPYTTVYPTGGVTFLPGPTLTVLPYARLPYTTVYPTGGVTFLPGPTLTVLPYARLPYTTVYPTGGVTFLPSPTLTVLPYACLPYTTVYPTGGVTFLPGPTLTTTLRAPTLHYSLPYRWCYLPTWPYADCTTLRTPTLHYSLPYRWCYLPTWPYADCTTLRVPTLHYSLPYRWCYLPTWPYADCTTLRAPTLHYSLPYRFWSTVWKLPWKQSRAPSLPLSTAPLRSLQSPQWTLKQKPTEGCCCWRQEVLQGVQEDHYNFNHKTCVWRRSKLFLYMCRAARNFPVVFVLILDGTEYTIGNAESLRLPSNDLPLKWENNVEVSLYLFCLNREFNPALTIDRTVVRENSLSCTLCIWKILCWNWVVLVHGFHGKTPE